MLAAAFAVVAARAGRLQTDPVLTDVLPGNAKPQDYKTVKTPGGLVCSGDGLTYFALKNSLSEEHGHNLDNECYELELYTNKNPHSRLVNDSNYNEYLNSTAFANKYYMHFQREKVKNVQQASGLSNNQARERRIPVPRGHPHCVPGGHIRCIPGPCRIWEYDYQSRHSNPAQGGRHQLLMVGQAKCGPLFGVQARKMSDNTLVPMRPADDTIKFFPTILTEQAEFDNAIDLNSPEDFRVPVPKNTSFNGNPYSYYTSDLAHRYGVPSSDSLLTDSTCAAKVRPPLTVPTKRARWTKTDSTLSLGMFDLADAERIYGGNERYKAFVDTNSVPSYPNTDTDHQNNEYVDAIPQLMKNLNNPGAIKASGKRSKQYQLDLQNDHEQSCDLSQCAWLPTIDEKTTVHKKNHQNLQDLETCFFAELRQLYTSAVQKYCANGGSDARVCPDGANTDNREDMSNPGSPEYGKILPEYCYSRTDIKPSQRTPHNAVFCRDFPYTTSYAWPGFEVTSGHLGEEEWNKRKVANNQRDDQTWCDVFIAEAKFSHYNSLADGTTTLCDKVYDNGNAIDGKNLNNVVNFDVYYNGSNDMLDFAALGLEACKGFLPHSANSFLPLYLINPVTGDSFIDDTTNRCSFGTENYATVPNWLFFTKDLDGYTEWRKKRLEGEAAARKGKPYFRYLTDNYYAWAAGQCAGVSRTTERNGPHRNFGGFHTMGIDYADTMYTFDNKDSYTPSEVKRKLPRFACGPRANAANLFDDDSFFKTKAKHFHQCFGDRGFQNVRSNGDNHDKPYAGLLECLMDTLMQRYRYSTTENDHMVLFVLSIITHIQPHYPTDVGDLTIKSKTKCKDGGDDPKLYDCWLSSKERGFWEEGGKMFAVPGRDPLSSDPGAESEFAFDAKTIKYFIWNHFPWTKPTAVKNRPLQWAITDMSEYRTESPLHLNASFLNAADNSESHACDCGNSPIMYAFNGIPWQYLPEKFRKDGGYSSAKDVANVNANELNTWVIEAGYAWQANVGNIQGAMSIGLFLPSNPKYSYNFDIVERDFLAPPRTNNAEGPTAGELLNRYYLGDQAPEPDVLVNELQFAAPTESTRALSDTLASLHVATHALNNAKDTIQTKYRGNGESFSVSKYTFEKGSCMRFPYGQVSRMEMSAEDQAHYFHRTPSRDKDSSIDNYLVGEESLMGYCENVADDQQQNTQYPYCFNDPNGIATADRTTFCEDDSTRFVVVGEAINERQFENVCNTNAKYCLLIPGEPLFPTIADVLSYKHHDTLEGYTLMVTPFNFSVARFLLGPGRFQYEVKGGYGPDTNTLQPLADSNTKTYGIRALSTDEFNVLRGNHIGGPSVASVEAAITEIKTIIDSTFAQGNGGSLSSWKILLAVLPYPKMLTHDYIYPPLAQTNIKVAHKNITIRSALKDGTLKFDRTPTQRRASQTCNRFLIAAPGFVLGKTAVDQTHCDASAQQIDRAAILYGGADVSRSTLQDLRVTGAETPVIFAGDDNVLFAHTPVVTANDVRIKYSHIDEAKQQYVVAAARTTNDGNSPITIEIDHNGTGPEVLKAIIQPLATDTCHIILAHNTTTQLVVIDASEYTGVFGTSIMRAEYPLLALPHHINYVLFVVLVTANAFLLGGALVAWCKFRNEPPIPPQETDASFVFTTPFGSAVAVNKQTGRYWNAYQLRRRLVKTTFGEHLFGVPESLKQHLLKSSFKTE
jgi:hypothetical protein